MGFDTKTIRQLPVVLAFGATLLFPGDAKPAPTVQITDDCTSQTVVLSGNTLNQDGEIIAAAMRPQDTRRCQNTGK